MIRRFICRLFPNQHLVATTAALAHLATTAPKPSKHLRSRVLAAAEAHLKETT